MKPERKNPWQKTGSKAIYDNPWIRVREDQVIRPDGKPGIYGIVHFKHRAVAVIALDKNEVVLVGQHRYTIDQYSWELPEGGCHEDETPLEAAQRELREETGLRARSWKLLGQTYTSNSVTDEQAFWFLAQDLEPGSHSPDGTEEIQVQRLPFSEVVQMAMNGQIQDALSLVAILHFAQIHRAS